MDSDCNIVTQILVVVILATRDILKPHINSVSIDTYEGTSTLKTLKYCFVVLFMFKEGFIICPFLDIPKKMLAN